MNATISRLKYFFCFTLFVLSSSLHSQRICDYGDYDFVLNKIKGVDTSKFSEVKVLDKEEPAFIYKYDSIGRLISANFFEESIETTCYGINDSYYVYPEMEQPNKIKVADDYSIHDAILTYYDNGNLKQINYNDFLFVDYEYNLKNQIKTIKKDRKVYRYSWNEDNKIEKITIDFLSNGRKQEIKFLYKNNRIEEVFHTQLSRGYLQINRHYSFTYNNERLCEIMYKNKRSNDIMYYHYNYDKKDKLIINIKDADKKYISHYECYY
ncbi:hypothetical protein [Olleya sp. ITB9]|uniref:hypothetical protein n=1 Tax=Olleya sp. ITB9 TaxID=1715648 RepID=UPI0006D0441F|nr:hypothetical protein [Olleya sp. ITB9]